MLEACHITAGYGSHIVLNDLSCTLRPGELTIILGRNGSGKTTLLHVLGGWKKPKQGTVRVDDIDLFSLRPKARSRQSGRLATALEDIQLPLERFVRMGAYGFETHTNSCQVRKDVGKALERMQIEDLSSQRLCELSDGQRQKAAIAQILVQNPRCLFLDEPGSSLDPAARFELMDLLASLKNERQILVAVLHDLDLALRYADRLLVLDQGTIVFDGTCVELVESDLLRRVFEIEVLDWQPESRTARFFPAKTDFCGPFFGS